ncbi:D-glycerate 3-kinase like protein [Zymoseptoria brevis]|uniref:D-glycerate 3-kinase like protein n=1 Tax=Zymoseptoria brevis TaxID=1047168 RepID=A0A0F4GXD2_9PEZI|nr:D-glycerate 3-kinase like protein [Zymoseptoria brevis]
MPDFIDDKSEHCIPFLLERLRLHREDYESKGETPPPFFLGLNGVQGAGKTTLVSTLHRTLTSPPHSLPVAVLSIDDLYLPHTSQLALASSHPTNPLIQHRGVPSTHDIPTGTSLFTALAARASNIRIPKYDKSRFNGAGDRAPEEEWEVVNREGERKVEVVVFEGWCVGFRALGRGEVERKWREAREQGEGYRGRLGRLGLEDVVVVDERLGEYEAITARFGAFVHIDAEDPLYVYHWREEQEAAMRAEKGTGMSKEQVVEFVNGYYPCYELYTEPLRKGIFEGEKGKQLRLMVGRDRKVKEVFVI